MSENKENYDITLNTVFSGEGGTITYHPDGDSDTYMCEGDRYFNIVGMEVVLPDNGTVTAAEAAAEISMVLRTLRALCRHRLESFRGR